jgi:hypothetical protein
MCLNSPLWLTGVTHQRVLGVRFSRLGPGHIWVRVDHVLEDPAALLEGAVPGPFGPMAPLARDP